MKIADANVVLRYLLDDNKKQANSAAKFLENDNIFLPFEVIAEIVYVLTKVYQVDKKELSTQLSALFNYPNISTNDNDVILYSLLIYQKNNFDFIDSILCAYKVIRGFEIITFDKKIKKFKIANGK